MFAARKLVATKGTSPQHLVVMVRNFGRHGGQKASEFPVRPPSKKQLKRKAKLVARLELKRDPKKEAIKMRRLEKQASSPKLDAEFKNMIAE